MARESCPLVRPRILNVDCLSGRGFERLVFGKVFDVLWADVQLGQVFALEVELAGASDEKELSLVGDTDGGGAELPGVEALTDEGVEADGRAGAGAGHSSDEGVADEAAGGAALTAA